MYLKMQAAHCPWPRLASRLTESETAILAEEVSFEKADAQQNLILQLQQQVKLSNLLNQINYEIRSTLDLEEILTSACRLLGEALKCSRTSILVKELDEEMLVTRGEYNSGNYASQLGMKVPIVDNFHLETVISINGPLAVTKFLDFPGLGEETREIAKVLGIRSMLACATRYQGLVNGVIGLQQCDRDREWTAWEQQLIEGVASQLAIAINQAKLYAETSRQAERESLLRLVSNQIRSTLDIKTILQTAVREVRQLLDTDRVVIYQFLDNWEGEVVVEDIIVPWPSIFGDSITDNCFSKEYAQHYLEGRVRAINDIQKAGLDRCHVNFLTGLQVKSNLIVPIVISSSESALRQQTESKIEKATSLSSISKNGEKNGNRLWGLLIAQECRSIRHWQYQETEFLRQLGEQMAIAINQAELYAQVKQAAIKSQTQAQHLQTALEELRSTQQQLIQSEKMSSLGQMVAGVAHEINNANNFIHANLFHAQEYAKTLIEAIDVCENANPGAAATISKVRYELELDYIEEDFPKMLKSMREGSDRIRSIVTTLRNFSRLDESEFKPANLNEGIESSLAMLQNRLQSDIEIEKEYGTLPLVECHAAQMNQVFFHLIQNALDAILASGKPGKITIRTEMAADVVTILIRDSGIGISPEIQNRIFDPFFTTKPVGQGTGLGLSICYHAIVKEHGGQIFCHSKIGEGTEFIVQLPLVTS